MKSRNSFPLVGAAALLIWSLSGAPVYPASSDLEKVPASKGASKQPESKPPETARDFFNAGTRRLNEGKLKEAEAFFETALARQALELQPRALYNVGHVRYAQGKEELKKTMEAGPASGMANAAARRAGEAITFANEALAGNEMDKLIAAYINGKGRRKELKAVTEAVKQGLEAYGKALRKWERSSGDFKSAAELNPSDGDASYNAQVVDESIARLIDSLQKMRQAAAMMGAQSKTLGEKMKELKGRIPAAQMPPGAAGDDEEDEDMPFGKDPGQKEGASKNGEEMKISPEQAGWMLQGFKLGDRRLPMAQGEQGKPRQPNRSPW